LAKAEFGGDDLSRPTAASPPVVCVQMNSPAGAAAADHKSAVAPSPRVAMLCSALPDVPKPVVMMIDAYLCRLPPSELIRELSAAISPKLRVDAATAAQELWSCPVFHMEGDVYVRAFYHGTHLRRMVCGGEPITLSSESKLMQRLRERDILFDPVTVVVTQLLAADPGALCIVDIPDYMTVWCTVLLAVPQGLSLEQVRERLPEDTPIKPLFEGETLCGLIVYQSAGSWHAPAPGSAEFWSAFGHFE
jgi:hypothetical protein